MSVHARWDIMASKTDNCDCLVPIWILSVNDIPVSVRFRIAGVLLFIEKKYLCTLLLLVSH